MILVLAMAAAMGNPDAEAAEKHLRDLQFMYDRSCQVRAYASYDDLCSGLRRQVRDAEKTLRRSKPRRGAAAPKAASPAAATPGPALAEAD